jgi:hypothetical protein
MRAQGSVQYPYCCCLGKRVFDCTHPHAMSEQFFPRPEWWSTQQQMELDPDCFSIVTDSDDTEDGNPGPGRSLDLLLSFCGRQADKLFSRIAARLGHGPNQLMLRALRLSAGIPSLAFTSPLCAHEESISEELRQIKKNATLHDIITSLFMSSLFQCPECCSNACRVLARDVHAQEACRSLIHLLK